MQPMCRPTRKFVVIAVPALALLALFAASARAADNDFYSRRLLQVTPFPPNCTCDRDASNSPYRLSLSNATRVPGFNVFCYKALNIGCNSTSKCCAGQGIQKVEFDVVPSCKSSLKRVTLNGVQYGAWEYNAGLGVLRVTSLNRTAATATNTEICLFLANNTACSNITSVCAPGGGAAACKYAIFNPDRDCCPVSVVGQTPPPPPEFIPIVPAFALPPTPPSPPPPPPPPIFPNCTCERDPTASRLTLAPVARTTTLPNGLNQVCFTVTTKAACDPKSSCCTFTLHKVEMMVKASCAGSLVTATVNGQRASRSFQTRPYPAAKVTNLGIPFNNIGSTEVCIQLRAPCNTLPALTDNSDGTIAVGLFNAPGPDTNCCPVYAISS